MATVVFVLSGTTVTIPSDWNSANNTVECIGAGGGGSFPCGGGGGEYRRNANQTYTQSASRTCQIGVGGPGGIGVNGTAGTFTSINDNTNAAVGTKAFGGGGATFNNATAPVGGTGGTGTAANFNGGAGGTGPGVTTIAPGSGGGAAGGPSGAGAAGGSAAAVTLPGGNTIGGAGGGGSNGGSIGVAQTNSNLAAGTTGGNGQGGTGGGGGGTTPGTNGATGVTGTAGTAGTGAGGGGGGGGGNGASGNGTNGTGGDGATGNIWTQTSNSAIAGPGGGGGGSGGNGNAVTAGVPGSGGLYGGGSGGLGNYGTNNPAAYTAANGILVLTYTPSIGAPKTLYLLGTTAVTPNFWGNMQDGGSAPTAANSAFGWLVAKIAIATSPYWRARLGATAVGSDAASATSFISGASGPTKGTGSGAGTAGDSFVAGPYNGTFAAGAWTLTLMVRASTAGAVGHLNMRAWRSANADGTSATSLTASLVGTAVTLSTTADVNGMGTTTWSPAAITLNNEYLFFQFEWQETTTGTSNSDNVLFRVGTALVTTTNFAPVQYMYAKRRFIIWNH